MDKPSNKKLIFIFFLSLSLSRNTFFLSLFISMVEGNVVWCEIIHVSIFYVNDFGPGFIPLNIDMLKLKYSDF